MARIGRSRPASDYTRVKPPIVTPLPTTMTGSVALRTMALEGSGSSGTVNTSGGLALRTMALAGTEKEIFETTGSVALPGMALAGSGMVQYNFPPGPLGMLFEILVGDTWTDITDFVYQRQVITITRGRPDESATVNPATCTFTLNNRNGYFSPRNPVSPYYMQIGRNTQMRMSAPTSGISPWVRGYRFWGEISEWPPTWDETGNDISVTISANGILRRLNQNAPLHSALYRYYRGLDTQPLAYWPAEDGSTASSLASGISGGFAMTYDGAPQLASDSGLPASSAFPALNGAIFTGNTGVTGALPVATNETLSATGTHNWTAPPGITEILVQAWGAGGGGSGENGSTGGAGGGGGEYASDSLAVTPGDVYSYTVGSSSADADGGSTVMHGDSSTSVTANGGGAGSSDGSTGGAGGTGSGAATHYDGGAGAAGSGGPGGGGTTVQNNQAFTDGGTYHSGPNNYTSTWACPSDYDSGSLQAYVWGGGGGGGAGGSANGGGGGGGGGFSQGSPSVSAGSNYTVTVGGGGGNGANGGNGSAGSSSSFNGGTTASGGGGGKASSGSNKGAGGTGNTFNGGDGASGDGNKGGGGGGGAGAGSGGSKGTDSNGGGAGGSGGASSGSLNGGGHGGQGGISGSGSQGGTDGDPTGGGGGGGYTDQFGANDSGGNGGRGKVWLFWSESTGAPDAAIGGGGGSSGGSGSAGNDGDTEAGGAAVAGGGPGGGTLAGSVFTAAPSATPGGGGGGYDSLGSEAAGAQGLITLSYAPAGTGAGVAANVLRFVLHLPSGGDTDDSVVARMFTTGTVDYVDVLYNVGGFLTLTGYNAAGSSLFTTGEVAFNAEGLYLLVSAELTTSGSDIDYNLTGILEGQTEVAASGSGTLTSASVGDVWSVEMNPDGALASTSFAHVAVQETYDVVTDVADAFNAYAGETAAARFTRVCTEQNLPYAVIGIDDGDTTALVGPQLPVNVTQLLQDCEDADRGLLFEPRDSFGITYRARTSLYVQDAATQLDYGAAQLGYPLQPTDDDQLIRNDVTMSRPNGSSAEITVTSGGLSTADPPDGVGPYTYSQDVNVFSDAQLPDVASWIAYIGTTDELRYPVINIDLSRTEAESVFGDVVGCDIGDYLQVVNTSDAPLPPGDVRQLIYGYTEQLNTYQWTIGMNCVPESPYEIALADDGSGDFARADTDGSQLHSGIGLGDTSFTVDTQSPNQPWIDDADYSGEFPFDITVGGEQMTVSGVSGTSSPQTFTVTRSVNGVQKAHNGGEAVNLYHPAIAAL